MPDDGPAAAPDLVLLRDIADRSPVATVALRGPSLRLAYVNPAFCAAAGATEAALLGQAAEACFPHLAGSGPLRLLARLREVGRHAHRAGLPLRLDPTGPPRDWEIDVAPLRHATESGPDLLVRLRDVTGLRRAGHEADVARAALDALFEHIPEGLILADAPEVRIRRVSAFGLDLSGLEAAAVVGRTAPDLPTDWQVLHMDGETLARPEELPLTRAARQGETVQHETWMLRRKDGTLLAIRCTAGPIRDAAGRITGAVLAWRDVTDRLQAEARLAESEARYRALVEAGALAVWLAGPEGGLRYGEDWRRLTGQPAAALAGLGWLETLHPEDRAQVGESWRAAVQAGAGFEAEFRLDTSGAPGEAPRGWPKGWHWVAARAVPRRDEREGVVEWVGVLTDIHARRMAEEALRASQDRFRTLAETMPHLVWQTDARGRPEYANRRLLEFSGLDPQQVMRPRGAHSLATIHPEDLPGLTASWRAALSEQGEFGMDARLRAPDGAWRWFRVQGAPVRDAAGRVRQWVGTCTDVDERIRTAEALQAALAAQEELARTAEHRIRNSLQLVAALLRLKAARLEAEPAAQGAVLSAVARVQAVAEAHRALQRSPDMRSVRLADILAELAAGTSQVHPGADLRTEADPALLLEADRAIPLALLLKELVTNALPATPDGPEAGAGAILRIAARARPAEAPGALEVVMEGLPAWPPLAAATPSWRAGLPEMVVSSLTRQIGATLVVRPSDQGQGVVVMVVLPGDQAD